MPQHIRTAEERAHPRREVRRPALLRDEPHRLPERVLADDVRREAVEDVFDVEGLPAGATEHLGHGALRELVHFPLELEHLLAREEAGERAFADPVQLVGYGREAGYGRWARADGVDLVLPFVAEAAGAGVDFVGEERVGAVEFVGVDADDGACVLL